MTDGRKNNGGKRVGAGRPKAKEKKITISCRVTPRLSKLLKKSGKPVAQQINNALESYFKTDR